MPVHWLCKPFNELTVYELYAILRLRSEVFVVEQKCAFLDADNKDQYSHHLMCWEDGLLVACSRLVPEARAFREPSIGRVVTSPEKRKSGLGKGLMSHSINHCYKLFGKQTIRIGAQLYLKVFYESFGFKQEGDVYDEDGIAHIEMVLLFKDHSL